MNEAFVVRYLVSGLKERLPGAVIFKHADLVTSGIPDISATFDGRTTWIEVKLLKNWQESISALRKKFNALQLATMRLLSKTSRAVYVVSFTDANGIKRLGIYQPEHVADFLTEKNYPPIALFEGSYTLALKKLADLIGEGR